MHDLNSLGLEFEQQLPQWRAAYDAHFAHPHDDTIAEHNERQLETMHDLTARIVAAPAKSLEDFLLKMKAALWEEGLFPIPTINRHSGGEASAVIREIERVASA